MKRTRRSRSVAKFIRRRKSEIRKKIQDPALVKEQINALLSSLERENPSS